MGPYPASSMATRVSGWSRTPAPAWKGDYINMGAGAEIGFYKQFGAWRGTPQWLADPSGYKPKMTMTLSGSDRKTIVSDNLKHTTAKVWTGAWNPHVQGLYADDLRATMTIDFSDKPDLFDAFRRGKNNLDLWRVYPASRTVTLQFRRRKRAWVR